jgi:hypothetical protein
MRVAVVLCAFAACSSSERPPPLANQGTVTVKEPQPSEPVRLALTQGKPSQLPGGTLVDHDHAMYAHLADSKNLSSCTLIVTRGHERKEIALSREHGGGDGDHAPSAEAFGWAFTLEYADPYQQPSQVVVIATPR